MTNKTRTTGKRPDQRLAKERLVDQTGRRVEGMPMETQTRGLVVDTERPPRPLFMTNPLLWILMSPRTVFANRYLSGKWLGVTMLAVPSSGSTSLVLVWLRNPKASGTVLPVEARDLIYSGGSFSNVVDHPYHSFFLTIYHHSLIHVNHRCHQCHQYRLEFKSIV